MFGRMKRVLRWTVFFLLSAFLLSCASPNIPPIGATGKKFELASDEKEIWQQSEKEQRKLAGTGKLYKDPLLEEYLAGIAKKLEPHPVKEAGVEFQFHVIKDPALNAFAYPNGHIYVHTGLISRLENEAQLAAVLGHEMSHVVHRDGVRYYRSAKGKVIAATVVGIAASIAVAAVSGKQAKEGNLVTAQVLNQTAQVMLGLGLQLGLLAAVNGYGRDLEDQADDGGLENMVRAGYDPKEASKVFQLFLKTYGDQTKIENFFFGNHSTNRERIENYNMLLATRYRQTAEEPGRVVNTEDFQRRTRALVRENALLDIEAGRYDLARTQLEKVLKLQPNDPKAHYYMGELYRRSAKDAGGTREAMREYLLALQYDPDYAAPHRELGLLYFKRKDKELAREHLKRYLDLAVRDCDRAVITEKTIVKDAKGKENVP
ncbi:MAG: M48 family metalloprotease [Candidatus Tectomicrobia bacterium]|uniref:M48 family metalloprotease n=1 Tax=Tectimicrobiota bacterium TaxID=2528274 RepID=A0A932GQF3_UNCTE|nr:M48 family metalloprotease [Candidatus Tectomicrobia bacterium]